MFQQFVLSRVKTLISKLNAPCLLHICGDNSLTLDAMGQTGVDILSLDQCMDLAESRKIVLTAVLGGNVDPINSFLMGIGEDVERHPEHCLEVQGPVTLFS